MATLELEKKLRPDAERLKINVDRRDAIIMDAYDLYCDELLKGGGLIRDIDLIGERIFGECGRIRKEAEFYKCVIFQIYYTCGQADLKLAEHIATKGYLKYEQILKELLPVHANDSEYECLIEDAEEMGLDRSKAEAIISVVRSSLAMFFHHGDQADFQKIGFHIDKIAMPFTDTCANPAEAKFFINAVEYLVYEDYGREREYAEKIAKFAGHRGVHLSQVKKEQSGKGCFVVLGFLGIASLGVYAAHHFLA